MKRQPTEYQRFVSTEYPGIKESTIRAAFNTLEGLDRLESSDQEDFERDFRYVSRVLSLLSAWRIPDESVWTFISCRSQPPGYSTKIMPGAHREGMTAVDDLTRFLQPSIKQNELRKAYLRDKLRDLFMMAYTKLDVALLCLADHLAKMGDVHLLNGKQTGLLREESETLFLPFLELLGCWRIRRDLLQTIRRNCHITVRDKQIHKLREDHINDKQYDYAFISKQLIEALQSSNIYARIEPHLTIPGNIYDADRQGRSVKDIARQNRINVIVSQEEECYRCLGIIHALWPPLTRRTITGSPPLRDLIAMPKYNGYRSLITNVQYSSMHIEFRIYTDVMERVNLDGVIAAKYLDPSSTKIKNAWWEETELARDGQVYAFTPVGEVYHFPVGSTALDFAYRIHSDLGNYCKSIWINGVHASHSQKLQNGDLIEIEVDLQYQSSFDKWRKIVKTTHAKKLIERSMRRGNHAHCRGRNVIDKILNQECELYNLPTVQVETVDTFLEQTAAGHDCLSLQDLYERVVDERPDYRLSPQKIVARLIATQLIGSVRLSSGQPLPVPQQKVQFAQCNIHPEYLVRDRVTPGSEIVGRLIQKGTKHERLVVYKKQWPHAPTGEDAIQLSWLDSTTLGMHVKISIKAVDKPRLLESVLQVIYDLYDTDLYLNELKATVAHDQTATIDLVVKTPNHAPIESLSLKLKQLQFSTIDSFRVDQLTWGEKKILARCSTWANPYHRGPVFDSRIFKGRDKELDEIIRALASGCSSVVLYGLTRIGKTSMLLYLNKQVASDHNFVPVFIDMLGLHEHSSSQFWLRVSTRIDKAVSSFYGIKNSRTKPVALKAHSLDNFCAYLHDVYRITKGRKLLILIDEFSELYKRWDEREAHILLQELVILLERESSHINFVFCLQQTFITDLQSPESLAGSRLFRQSLPVKLDYLKRDAAEELIRNPMGMILIYEESVVKELLRVTACHPYFLQGILWYIVDLMSEYACYPLRALNFTVTHDILEMAISRALGSGDYLFYDYMVKCGEDTGEMIIKSIASILRSNKSKCSLKSLEELVSKNKLELEKSTLIRILKDLEYNRVIESHSDIFGHKSYAFSVPLFEHWLHDYKK